MLGINLGGEDITMHQVLMTTNKEIIEDLATSNLEKWGFVECGKHPTNFILDLMEKHAKTDGSMMHKTMDYLYNQSSLDKEEIDFFIKTFMIGTRDAASVLRHGNKTFRLSNNLFMCLLNTDPVLDLTDIKFPYRSFYISIGDFSDAIIPISLSDEWQKTEVLGIYVHDAGDHDFCISAVIRKEGNDEWSDPVPYVIGMEKREYKSKEDFHGDEKITETYGTVFNKKSNQHELIIELTSLVINTLYYIDSNPKDCKFIKTGEEIFRKKGVLSKKGLKTIKKGYILIGEKFDEIAPMEDFDFSSGTPKHKFANRFWVRGHWRKQPYGPRSNPSYRMQRIPPHIKGPEGTPIANKNYVVK